MHTSQVQLVDAGLVRGHDVELLLRQGDDLLHLGEQALGLVGGGFGALKKRRMLTFVCMWCVLFFPKCCCRRRFRRRGGLTSYSLMLLLISLTIELVFWPSLATSPSFMLAPFSAILMDLVNLRSMASMWASILATDILAGWWGLCRKNWLC